ncbi:hypothetical protein H7F51_01340 [Novosphingobium flavum]|uniref:Uncharacterized protein n=1 Tax=Novosphingobium flavum TaxID=1778672 RepID=A0A7X1KKG3_9SPHN|nr:hypothetical protein [Novosphingobium flavum]MBC2664155.1 hypothetical protein [Novosphingobium flavum]
MSQIRNIRPTAPATVSPQRGNLRELARNCEEAGFGQQSGCLTAATHLLGNLYLRLYPRTAAEMLDRAEDLARAGAFESAALALLPPRAVFTGGRLADGSVIAQVQLNPGHGTHSRNARWLSMAVLAALLRALAETAGPQALDAA